MTDANTVLMQSIHTRWGSAIDAACRKSSVSPAFLAGLVANESGGNQNAKRFEKAVLADLWEVLQGRAANYGSITRDSIVTYLTTPPASDPTPPVGGYLRYFISATVQQLDGLATSWGLTQIMGYEAIPFATRAEVLYAPDKSFSLTMRMLAQFALHWNLDLSIDFSEMFSCWNTGRPHAATADPQYVPNGLLRMEIYQGLLDGPPKAMSA